MDVRVEAPDRLDAAAAEMVASWLSEAPSGTFLAAMGTSPLGIYAELARRRDTGRLDLADVRLVQLDEYLGVADDDHRSLFGWLQRDVAAPLGISNDRLLRIYGDAPDPEAEAARHDAAVRASGGVDVSVLGLGPNGHLGFNEPPSSADAPTRVVDLTPASLESNARYWGAANAVPRRAITLGMNRLLAARHTLLVVNGPAKRAVLRRLVAEPVSDDLPASHLRSARGAVLLADTDAWPDGLAVPTALDA